MKLATWGSLGSKQVKIWKKKGDIIFISSLMCFEGRKNRLGPWGFFAEYWIFEVWLPWTIVIKPFMWWSKLFLKSNNADHQDHQNHPPVRGAAGEGTMAGIWPLPAFTCLALQIFVYFDQLNRQFYQYHQYHQDYRYHQDQFAKTAIFGPKTLFLALIVHS